MSDKPKLAKRRPIRKAELLEICERQNLKAFTECGRPYLKDWLFQALEMSGRCECGCNQPFIVFNAQLEQITDPPEYDHRIPNALLYEGDKIDWCVLRKSCHAIKTKKDVADIAKAKRMAGETGQYARRKRREKPLIQSNPTIQSRSFPKAPEGHSRWPKRKFGS